jgi:hypothetical protein
MSRVVLDVRKHAANIRHSLPTAFVQYHGQTYNLAGQYGSIFA